MDWCWFFKLYYTIMSVCVYCGALLKSCGTLARHHRPVHDGQSLNNDHVPEKVVLTFFVNQFTQTLSCPLLWDVELLNLLPPILLNAILTINCVLASIVSGAMPTLTLPKCVNMLEPIWNRTITIGLSPLLPPPSTQQTIHWTLWELATRLNMLLFTSARMMFAFLSRTHS
jgi:hypothetical protein